MKKDTQKIKEVESQQSIQGEKLSDFILDNCSCLKGSVIISLIYSPQHVLNTILLPNYEPRFNIKLKALI